VGRPVLLLIDGTALEAVVVLGHGLGGIFVDGRLDGERQAGCEKEAPEFLIDHLFPAERWIINGKCCSPP
jgi:hypothetical protein